MERSRSDADPSDSSPATRRDAGATRPLLEVCIEDARHAGFVASGGADRIELCADLAVGGVSPAPTAMRAARERCGLPIFAMVRPRAGGFRYDAAELRAMEATIDAARENGMAGVVLGALDERRRVDAHAVERLVARAGGLPVTFHRAFDDVADPETALEQLVDLGIARLLTSGGAKSAPEGAAVLARWIERAAGRLVVMPGGGVRASNAAPLVARTGARELHTSAGFPSPPTTAAVAAIVDALRSAALP